MNKANRHLTLLTAGLLLVLLVAVIISSCCNTGNDTNQSVPADRTENVISPSAQSAKTSESDPSEETRSDVIPSDTDPSPSSSTASLSSLPFSAPVTTSPESTPSVPATTVPAPLTTASPVTTSLPMTTATPVTTALPVTTATPVTTASPVTTATPVTTASPVTTATPVTTASPVTTATPVTEPETPETTSHVHSFSVWTNETAPTCTEKGTQIRTCSCGEKETRTVDASGHKAVSDPAVTATPRTPGLSAGSHCETCGTVITEQNTVYFNSYSDPSLYVSHYYYDYIGTLPKGDALQKLYNIFEADCLKFHSSGKDAEPDDHIVSAPNVTELGLTIEEAYSVWTVFRYDHPLYYWIKPSVGGFKTTSGTEVTYYVRLYCQEEYVSGAIRTAANQKIYDAIADFQKKLSPESSDYMMAFQIHDAIARKIDYAYSAPNIPEESAWAHSIEGFFLHNAGVCECYAKTFLMLTSLNDIDCIFVSNADHAWNMLRADDGDWYWVDATWDDAPNWEEGVCHLYFCVNDTEKVWRGYYNESLHSETFFTDPMHSLDLKTSVGEGFLISLPARSSTPFSSTKHPIKVENFTVGHNDYYISGYDTVSVKKYYTTDVFPDTIEYSGRTYRIIKP